MDSKKASRRKFLKSGAAVAAVSAIQSATGQSATAQTPAPVKRSLKDEVAYGERSQYVNSIRIAVNERPSPDEFGLTFHVLTPLQDSVGIITPSALHFVGTHRGAIVPDIKPNEYRFLLHGMVDRPLEFTLEELKRFPAVSQIHFLECLGNRAKP
jgi:sulfane dehydrogenase subunit SoxC